MNNIKLENEEINRITVIKKERTSVIQNLTKQQEVTKSLEKELTIKQGLIEELRQRTQTLESNLKATIGEERGQHLIKLDHHLKRICLDINELANKTAGPLKRMQELLQDVSATQNALLIESRQKLELLEDFKKITTVKEQQEFEILLKQKLKSITSAEKRITTLQEKYKIESTKIDETFQTLKASYPWRLFFI